MLSHPAAVQARLEEIEQDLASRQLDLEQAALGWFKAKREREKERAIQFLSAQGTVAVRSARADAATALIGVEEEALFESLKAVTRVLDTRASIGMSLLRSQGRH